MTDPIVEKVRQKLFERSQTGIKKYGVDMTRTDLSHKEWLIHAQEEALDFAVYLQRLIEDSDRIS